MRKGTSWVAVALLQTVVGCAGGEETSRPNGLGNGLGDVPSQPQAGTSSWQPQDTTSTGGGGAPVTPGPTAGTGVQPEFEPGGDDPVEPSTDPVQTAGEMPCEIERIAQAKCQGCHAATPTFGAPMPLVTVDDFAAMSPTEPTMTVAQSALDRINRPDPAGKMPPASVEALSDTELAALNTWLEGGHQPGSACEGGLPDEGGGEQQPDDSVLDDEDITCYEFRAHTPQSEAPYSVGVATDAYFNFPINAPWQGTQYARAFVVKIDNAEVVHHWLLYKDPAPHINAGDVVPSIGAHPGGELVHGWAPGGEDLMLDADAAIPMPETGFTLELHYNSRDPSATDNTGLDICVTPNAPANLAAISWLGTDLINGTTATGVCAPFTNERIRILGGTPHMHTYGRHMKVEILRADGSVDVIHDEPFDFDFQRSYDFQDQEIWIEPGDQISTTCTWTRPVTFGEGTGDEMCYFFTLHYPGLALASPGLDDAIHGPNSCGVL